MRHSAGSKKGGIAAPKVATQSRAALATDPEFIKAVSAGNIEAAGACAVNIVLVCSGTGGSQAACSCSH